MDPSLALVDGARPRRALNALGWAGVAMSALGGLHSTWALFVYRRRFVGATTTVDDLSTALSWVVWPYLILFLLNCLVLSTQRPTTLRAALFVTTVVIVGTAVSDAQRLLNATTYDSFYSVAVLFQVVLQLAGIGVVFIIAWLVAKLVELGRQTAQ